MAQDASRWFRRCSKRPQDRPKTAPRGQRASQGSPQEAKILQLAWRRTQPHAVVSATLVSPVFGGAPYGATKRVRGVPKRGCRPRAGGNSEALGGAPYRATKRMRGVPKRGWGRVRNLPLGPSVERPMGARNAVLGGGDACEHPHWGLRWGSLWGHEACEGRAETCLMMMAMV